MDTVTVSGNYLQGDRFAIRLNDANDVSVTGNVCVMPSDDTSVYRAAVDIYSQAQNPDSERIVLANNVVRSAQIGVAVGVNPATQDPSNDIDIAGNSIHYIGASAATAGYDGINVLSGNRVSVRGNRVRSFGNGIDARGSVDVLENSVYNSEVYGIRLVGADARVCRGNITRGSTSAGLRIESSANNPSVIILGNVITDRTSGSTGSLTRFGNVFPGSITSALTSASAASIGNAVSGINTIGKHTGKIIRDSTNERLVYALGPNPTDGWRVADGSLTVTPS